MTVVMSCPFRCYFFFRTGWFECASFVIHDAVLCHPNIFHGAKGMKSRARTLAPLTVGKWPCGPQWMFGAGTDVDVVFSLVDANMVY